MTAIQSICARIGRVTGEGLAANMMRVLPRPLVSVIVLLLFVANTVNIGADLAAMGARRAAGAGLERNAVRDPVRGRIAPPSRSSVPYHRYVHVLKWLTLTLLAYVGVVFTVAIDWDAVAPGILWPQIAWSRGCVDHCRRRVRHDDQPLLVLLAKRGRGRRREARGRRLAARPSAGRAGGTRPDRLGHLHRNGLLQRDFVFHLS